MLKTSSQTLSLRLVKGVKTRGKGGGAEGEKRRLIGRTVHGIALLFIINREGTSTALGRLSREWKKIIAFFHKNNGEALDIQETL